MNIKNIIKIIGKNFLAFIVGGILGILGTLIIVPIVLQRSLEGKSIGAIALIPVFFIIYGIFGIIIGGVLGIIVYNLIKYFRNR